jgi:hypothetical protein
MMPQDYAMVTLDQMLARKRDNRLRGEALDPAMRAQVARLVSEVRAINFRPARP